MKNEAVIVLDCGATNIRAVAVAKDGLILATRSYPNQTNDDPFFPGGKIWNVDDIWSKLCLASKAVITELEDTEIIGACITTFGVDGAPFDKDGRQLYPVISWACNRTKSVLEETYLQFPLQELYKKTGICHFDFNTLYKIFWIKKFRADVFRRMHAWLFMPSIFSYRLSGSMHTDMTMLGTSMMNDMKSRSFSPEILKILDLHEANFPALSEAGRIVGKVAREASGQTGLPAGLPVISAGHDTQFAIFGSGAGINQPVLSSGTWEILMVRTPEVQADQEAFEAGITTEYDAIPGLYNPGLQWLGSGVLEGIRKKYFADSTDDDSVYDVMIREAKKSTSRGKKYLEALKTMARKTKTSLQTLEKNCGFKAASLLVVGGGSKNELWNDLRADELGIAINTIPQKEATVLGAAMFAFVACACYTTVDEARRIFLKTYTN